MIPSHLDHSDFFITEVVDHISEKIRRRNEIRIKNSDELPFGNFHSFLQSPGFEPVSILSMEVNNINPLGSPFSAGGLGDFRRVIRAIIQNLHLKPVAGIIHPACRSYHTLGHHVLIKHRKLNRHIRQFGLFKNLRGSMKIMTVFHIKIYQYVPVKPI